MTGKMKIYLAVAGGLMAAGIILAGVGFAASGFDPALFSSQVDSSNGIAVLGGVEIEDPAGLPFVGILANLWQ